MPSKVSTPISRVSSVFKGDNLSVMSEDES